MKKISMKLLICILLLVTTLNVNAQEKNNYKLGNSEDKTEKDTAIVLKDGSQPDPEFDPNAGIKELSLEQAIELALKNNLGLQDSAIDLRSKKWSVITLFNDYYPTLSLAGSMIGSLKSEEDRKMNPQVPFDFQKIPGLESFSKYAKGFVGVLNEEVVSPQWNASLSFNLQWTFNAAMIFGSYNSVLDYQSGKITFEDAKAQLEKNVKQFYYQLALNKASFEIELNKLASKKDRYEQAQVKYKNGMTPKLDVLSTQVDYESYKPQLSSLGNTIVYLQNMLQYYIGEKIARDLVLTDTFIVEQKVTPKFKDVVELFEKNNLNLKKLYIAKKQASNALNTYIAQLTPSFSLGLGIMPTLPDATKQWFGDDSNKWTDRGQGLTLSLSLPLSNWLPFSKAQVGIVGANFAKKKIDIQIENYIQAQKVSIKKSIDDIRTAIQNIESMNLTVKMAIESYNETVKAYNLGTREVLDVKDAENTLFQMEYQQLATEYTYRNSLLELEYLLNTSLEEILKIE